MGGNRNKRQEEKRTREQSKKDQQKTSQQKAKDDAAWRDDDKQAKKKAARKAEAEAKRDEALKRKAELKRLEAEENASIDSLKKKKGAAATPRKKITQFEIQQQKERDMAASRAAAAEKGSDTVGPMVLTENINLSSDMDAVTDIDAALAALSVGGGQVETHPEKRVKALWNAFFERRHEELKTERPGLRLTQYREVAWKEWQKSPENPFNQDHSTYNGVNPSSVTPDKPELKKMMKSELMAMTKVEILTIIKAHASKELLFAHQLGGAIKTVSKKRTQAELITAYQACYKAATAEAE